ncbi:hypothetical protein ZWY2020_015437 [Hordeum vulgare]|nr:hypothetical protein ZWY2020_015437 [Hordeum vulgare]
MVKHTSPVRMVTVLLIICLLAVEARGRIIGDGDNKISLPNGLCVYDRGSTSCSGDDPYCYCCLVGYYCYKSMDVCKEECLKKLSRSPSGQSGDGNTFPIA